MTELARELEQGGGANAPHELSARLRELLDAELRRGRDELWLARSGYPDPLAVALAPGYRRVLAALPVDRALRADPGAVSERAGLVAAATVEKLVEATAGPPPASPTELRLELGDLDGLLLLAYPAADPAFAADYAAHELDDLFEATDRLRCRAYVVPEHVLAGGGDLREPIGPTHPLKVAEAAARLGGTSLDEDSLATHEDELLSLLEPEGSVARAHDEPDPVRRVARRILQRLDGMGKWGGYHTEFEHLARGFGKGNERALAKEVGEALLAAGLLAEKTSVGQRHVFLNPRRSGDIRRLIDDGLEPPGLRLP